MTYNNLKVTIWNSTSADQLYLPNSYTYFKFGQVQRFGLISIKTVYIYLIMKQRDSERVKFTTWRN